MRSWQVSRCLNLFIFFSESRRMSRIRTTLDSVTKAVGSTDLISKISRLKPGGAAVSGAHVDNILVNSETPNNNSAPPSPEAIMKEEDEGGKNVAEKEQEVQVRDNYVVATKKSKPSLLSAANVSSSTVAKQTIQLFQPAALSTNMDETYKTLAQHVNNYFGMTTQEEVENTAQQQDRVGDRAQSSDSVPHLSSQRAKEPVLIASPVAEAKIIEATTTSPSISITQNPACGTPPSSDTPKTENATRTGPVTTTSAKKGFTQYLSYPRPSVQSFVGSYIAPLVPKFRGDSKGNTAEKDIVPAVAAEEPATDRKVTEKTESEEGKVDEAKQQLLTQRQKVRHNKKFVTMKRRQHYSNSRFRYCSHCGCFCYADNSQGGC